VLQVILHVQRVDRMYLVPDVGYHAGGCAREPV
jgi:hypothetical protein